MNKPALRHSRAWKGRFCDCRIPTEHEVQVAVAPGLLTIQFLDSRVISWATSEIHQTQGFFGGEQIRFEHRKLLGVLTIQDHHALAALSESSPGLRLHRPLTGSRLLRRLSAVFLCFVLMVAGAMWGVIPKVAQLAADLAPDHWDQYLDAALLEEVAPKDDRIQSPGLQTAIEAIMQHLAGSSGIERSFRVLVLSNPEENALALPGGTIIVNTGLLKRTQRPEELAGVLAHEMAHVLRRHSRRNILRGQSLRALAYLMTGSLVWMEILADSAFIASLHYERQDEWEADREALRLLSTAHIDPSGLIAFMQHIERTERLNEDHASAMSQYLSTHPLTEDRIQAMKAIASSSNVPKRPLLPTLNWNSLVNVE